MRPEPSPEWLEAYGVEERELDEAYAALSQTERALLKKTIAQLFAFYGEHHIRERRLETHWSEGLASIEQWRPAPWAFACIAPDMASPAQLLAAILPPVSLGVEHCLVARTSVASPWPAALLCALELAGIERVYSLPKEHLPHLLAHLMEQAPSGVALGLGECGLPRLEGKGPRFVALRPPRSVALWSDGSVSWDLQAISFAHPRLRLIQQESGEAPLSFETGPGSDAWSAFVNQDVDGLFVPAGLMPSALQHHRLVLGPGQEACWVWPDLTRDVFLERRLAWFEGADLP